MSGCGPELPTGFCLHRYETVGSTNDEAKVLARAGAADGAVVWAQQQSAGRGRRGRVWSSPPGNLYLSLMLRPDASAPRAAQLGFVAALGLGGALLALAGSAFPLRYKWPNDVLAGGRKLAGILLETELSGAGRVDFVVVGVGVNIATAPAASEYPATSLVAEGIAGVSPMMLIEAFLDHFAAWRKRWCEDGFAPLRAAWLGQAAGLGEPVCVRLDRQTLDGRFRDLDENGALILDTADGPRHIAAGEVFPAA